MTFSSVKELLEWKVGKNKIITSIEDVNKEILQKLEWDECDVLYSFLGIYAIGFWVYNKEEFGERFKVAANKIYILKEDLDELLPKRKWVASYQVLNSKIFLNYANEKKSSFDYNIEELNLVMEKLREVYCLAGNLIPMWPGGNTLKGKQDNGFMDVPEIFFYKYKKWFEILKKEYPNAYMDHIIIEETRFANLKSFLESVNTPEKFNAYIEKAVSSILKRTELLEKYCVENCTK